MEKEVLKTHAPKPEAPKTPPQKPEVRGETLFVGEGKPVEEEKPKEKKVEKKAEPKKTLSESKAAKTPAKVIIEQAMGEDPLVRQIFTERPIKNPEVEEFVAFRLAQGRKLVDIGRDLNEGIYGGGRFTFTDVNASFEAMRVLNRIQQATGVEFTVMKPYEAGAGGTSPAVEALFDPSGVDPEIKNSELAQRMKDIQNDLRLLVESSNNPLLHNMHEINSLREKIAQEARKNNWDHAEVNAALSRLEEVMNETRRAEDALHPHVERFSNIYLQPKEVDDLNRDPRWMVEKYLRKIEKDSVLFPDTTIAEEAQRRLGLMGGYFSHEQFIEDVRAYVERPENAALYPDPAAKQAHIDDMISVASELSEKVNFRTNIQKVYGMIRGLGDPEKISSTLINVGEAGFEFLLNENGGLVDVAFNKYVHLLKQARFDSNGNLRRLTPDVLYEIRAATIEEMKKDKALYNEMYKKADNGFGRDLTDTDCEAIVGLAEFGVVMTEQNLVAMLGGLGPGETFGKADLSSFLSAGPEEQILGAMDIQRWFFEKWTNLKPAQKVIWENGCRFATEAGGRMDLIEKRLKGVNQGDARFMEIAKEVFGKDEAGRLKTLLEFDSEGHQRKHLPKSFSELSMKDLRDRFTVAEGEKVIGEMLTVYDHFSSGWRLDTHLKQINAIWGKKMGGRLGLGFRLREAGANLLKAEADKKDKIKQREELQQILRRVAHYRPQALFEFLNDGKFEPAQEWLTSAHQSSFSRAFPKESQITSADQVHKVYRVIGRRFIAINELLAESGIGPINYAIGPTNEQRTVVERVCSHMDTNTDEYISFMKELSDFVRQDGQIHELTTDQYLPVYRRTRWLDDSRLRYLENPDKAHGVAPKGLLGISKRFTYSGRGSADPLVRTWRDTNLAVKTVPEVMASFTVDRKALQKALVAINSNVRQYSGEPYGSRAVFYLLAGWGKTAGTDTVKDWLFLNLIPNSSAARRLLGDEAPSLGKNELEHLVDEYDLALMSKMKLLAPEMSKDLEEYLGIRGKLPGKLEKLPLYVYRARLFIAIAAILLIMEGLKGVKEEAK